MGHSITEFCDRLIRPDPALAGCVFAGIVRNTNGRGLAHVDRFNLFPASPLCTVSWFFQGCSHAVTQGIPDPDPLPRLLLAGPQSAPVTSWNPGEVVALSVGFYPDAWHALTGHNVEDMRDRMYRLDETLEGPMLEVFHKLHAPDGYRELETALVPIWQSLQPTGGFASSRLADWGRALGTRAALSETGRSLRQIQRRIKRWTGQNRQTLSLFARVEALEQLAAKGGGDLADLAQKAGFSDQSHMGRALKQVTGYSPAALNQRIAKDEPFWAYRLLGERF